MIIKKILTAMNTLEKDVCQLFSLGSLSWNSSERIDFSTCGFSHNIVLLTSGFYAMISPLLSLLSYEFDQSFYN